MTTATVSPLAQRSTEGTDVDLSGRSHLTDQRLAALVDELSDRDRRHLAEAAARRPVLWLLAMTATAVALAQLAVAVAVVPF